jgi:hypothetical protein
MHRPSIPSLPAASPPTGSLLPQVGRPTLLIFFLPTRMLDIDAVSLAAAQYNIARDGLSERRSRGSHLASTRTRHSHILRHAWCGIEIKNFVLTVRSRPDSKAMYTLSRELGGVVATAGWCAHKWQRAFNLGTNNIYTMRSGLHKSLLCGAVLPCLPAHSPSAHRAPGRTTL